MKNKIVLAFIVILTFCLSICVVAASENTTDIQMGDVGDDLPVASAPVKSNSTFSASNVKGYDSFSTKFTVQLKSGGKPLAKKAINITINDVTYKRTTDKSGKASVNVKLSSGKYKALSVYQGDENNTPCKLSHTITIKDSIKTKLKVADKDINYRQGSKCAFIVKLLDANGKALKNKEITFKVNGKTYSAKTDSEGYAKIFLNLKKGSYKVKFSFSKSAPYLGSSGSHKIKVKAPMGKGNGYWLWTAHMKSINLKNLAAKGTKQIFLHSLALYNHGYSAVKSFISKAHKYGMKVHIWMQVCYDGTWVSPVNKDNSFKYSFMNKKIAQAKEYARIKGVDGIHLDYMRFGGTAHNYKTSTDAINYLVKKISVGVHSVKSNCIVSVAVMPEPSMMLYYYGQDIPTMSKYVDAILPMVYKGNYHKDTSWIKSVTNTFVKQSNGAQIWTGLQAYKSDSNAAKLPVSELLKDAKSAKAGGAAGVVLFRIGVSHYLNFNKV